MGRWIVVKTSNRCTSKEGNAYVIYLGYGGDEISLCAVDWLNGISQNCE